MSSSAPTETFDLLYHIKRTIIDYATDDSGATRNTDILGTYTDLAAAKTAAKSALRSEGYEQDDFSVYEFPSALKPWKHGDGVLAYAKAPAGQEFTVRIDTTPNLANLHPNGASGEVEGALYYVLQTTINYNDDRLGAAQDTEVQGTYTTLEAATEAAKTALLDAAEITKESFVEYDEKGDDRDRDEWPYGDDVFVHAVAETGENFRVAVKAKLQRK